MSLFKPVSEKSSNKKIKKIFEDIKSKRKISKIPNFWRAVANDPKTLERDEMLYRQIEGPERKVKGGQGTVTDKINKSILFIIRLKLRCSNFALLSSAERGYKAIIDPVFIGSASESSLS